MAMLLDYGKKTVTVAPFKVTTTYAKSVNNAVSQPVRTVLNVKQQVSTGITTKPLATALKPTATVVKVPYVMEALPKAQLPVMPWDEKKTQATKAVTTALTTAQKTAIAGAMATKYGQAVVSSPPNQAMIAKLRTIAVLTQIKRTGLELAPKGTTEAMYGAQEQTNVFRDAVNSLLTQQEQWTAKQTEYQNLLSARETELAKGTFELGVVKSQLAQTQESYLDILARYNELLANPPEKPGTDIFGGLGDFIAKYGLWIALGVGAIILLPSIMRIFERR